jgi:hypothetical protein
MTRDLSSRSEGFLWLHGSLLKRRSTQWRMGPHRRWTQSDWIITDILAPEVARFGRRTVTGDTAGGNSIERFVDSGKAKI